MNPQGMLGQLNQSMQQGVPALGQVTGTSPNFQPGLQVPPPGGMPNKSPMSEIHKTPLHRALERRGMSVPPQLQQAGSQPTDVTMPSVSDQSPTQPGIQIPPSEAELIIKALSSRLGLLGKHESAIRDHLLPPKSPKGTSEK